MADTFWTHAGQNTVTVILYLAALYLYWLAIEWSARRIVLAEQQAERVHDLQILYDASLAFIARRETARLAPIIPDEDEKAFALDEPMDLSA